MENPKTGAFTFKCFTHEQVKSINKEIFLHKQRNEYQEDSSAPAAYASKRADVFRIPCEPLLESLHMWICNCQAVNRDIYGYNIDWQFHLDMLNYNIYGETGQYDWHIDGTGGDTLSDTKLTCLLNLSEEPYEGGEFSLINHDSNEIIEFTSGMGLVFNSMIAHKVSPVTKGERKTLTYWATGPAWK